MPTGAVPVPTGVVPVPTGVVPLVGALIISGRGVRLTNGRGRGARPQRLHSFVHADLKSATTLFRMPRTPRSRICSAAALAPGSSDLATVLAVVVAAVLDVVLAAALTARPSNAFEIPSTRSLVPPLSRLGKTSLMNGSSGVSSGENRNWLITPVTRLGIANQAIDYAVLILITCGRIRGGVRISRLPATAVVRAEIVRIDVSGRGGRSARVVVGPSATTTSTTSSSTLIASPGLPPPPPPGPPNPPPPGSPPPGFPPEFAFDVLPLAWLAAMPEPEYCCTFVAGRPMLSRIRESTSPFLYPSVLASSPLSSLR